MNSARRLPNRRGFTLIELLCVIAIIGILAAMLLPTLSRTKARAKRIDCVNNLKEMGVAFHSFLHDHQNRFPMETPMSEGGTLEFAQNGFLIPGQFYFSYRHFQVLSNELVQPRLLWCSTDVNRDPAVHFWALQNSNVSYFVGINAKYDQPDSVLAGDRNLTNSLSAGSSIVYNAYGVRWTSELHRFKGNALFADARVEQVNSLDLNLGANLALVIPTVPGPGTPVPPQNPSPSGPGSGINGGGGGGPSPANSAASAGSPNQSPAPAPPAPSGQPYGTGSGGSRSLGSSAVYNGAAVAGAPGQVDWSNAPVAARPAHPGLIVEDPELPINVWLAETVVKPLETSDRMWLLYLLLLLLLLALVARALSRRLRRRKLNPE